MATLSGQIVNLRLLLSWNFGVSYKGSCLQCINAGFQCEFILLNLISVNNGLCCHRWYQLPNPQLSREVSEP